MHGKRRRRCPIKHKANYKHPESMHKDYPPEEMDRIKKEDPNALFSPTIKEKEYSPDANIDRSV